MLTSADYDRNLLRKKNRCLRTSHRSFCSRFSVLSLGRARVLGRVESAARGSYDSGSADNQVQGSTHAWLGLTCSLSCVLATRVARRCIRPAELAPSCLRARVATRWRASSAVAFDASLTRCTFQQHSCWMADGSGLEISDSNTRTHLISRIHIRVLQERLVLTASIGG